MKETSFPCGRGVFAVTASTLTGAAVSIPAALTIKLCQHDVLLFGGCSFFAQALCISHISVALFVQKSAIFS